MMDELIHQPKSYLLLSETCDEILHWMKNHLVSDSNCNSVNLQSPGKMTKNVGLTFSVGDTYYGLQLVLSKTIRIGDSKYQI